MQRLALLPLLTAAAAGAARADSAPSVIETAPTHEVAVAINTPLIWKHSFATSAWIGWNDHHALRLNFARYQSQVLWHLLAPFVEGASDVDFGRTTDLGAGWVYYPRRVLDGATLEVGLMARIRRERDAISDDNVASEERHTNTYGARALAGWTWRLSGLSHRLFFSIGIGASVGNERGREKRIIGYNETGVMTVQEHVSRPDIAAEGYLRMGAAFGL